ERFDKEKGRRLLADAIKKIDELTDKEKYGILAFYARAVENDLQKATEHLKTLLALYPDYSAGHNNLAWFYSQMGRFDEAVAEYEEAIRVDPSFMLPYGGLSYIYLNRFGEIDKAVALCSQQLKYDDQNPLAYDCLGWAYLGKGEMEKAEEAFRKALESYPEYTLDLFRLAHTYRLQGRYQDAIEPLQKIIEIDPAEEPSALYDLGMVYELMGNEEEAKKHFERYLRAAEKWVEEYPNNPMSYFCLGLALTHLGQKAEGLAVGQKALMFDPTRHFEYAELLSAQGKTQEALDQLELAVEKGYRNFIWMKIDVNFHPLYEEPRFKELIRKHLKQ
ncbi:MAG: tetratricopeptide repeat protein, partial [Candidatus Aminicenantales bacterium]